MFSKQSLLVVLDNSLLHLTAILSQSDMISGESIAVLHKESQGIVFATVFDLLIKFRNEISTTWKILTKSSQA